MVKTIFKSIKKRWYVYISTIVVTSFAVSYYVDFANKPRNEETLTIFTSSFNINNSVFRNKLLENSPDYLREVLNFNVSPQDRSFSYYFQNQGLNVADIFILPETVLFDELLQKQFAVLDENYLNNFFTYETEPTNHGILVHKKGDTNNNLLQFTKDSFDDNYYLFYRINSIHAGMLNNSSYDTSIVLTKYILNNL